MLKTELVRVLSTLPGIILGFTIHEFFHALTALKLGDSTAKNAGRLTLDPRKHIEPIGFILILIAGFGWARPVPVNHSNFKNPRRDDLIVSISGPFSNIFLALFFLIIIKTFIPIENITSTTSLNIFTILYYSAY